MGDYHVGCSEITGVIYAGRAKTCPSGMQWIDKSEVTDEAIGAVVAKMLYEMKKGDTSFGYRLKLTDGRHCRLRIDMEEQ